MARGTLPAASFTKVICAFIAFRKYSVSDLGKSSDFGRTVKPLLSVCISIATVWKNTPWHRLLFNSSGAGAGGKALADFGEELSSAGRMAAFLAGREAGFRLAFRNDMRDKIVEQSLHACAGGDEFFRKSCRRQ